MVKATFVVRSRRHVLDIHSECVLELTWVCWGYTTSRMLVICTEGSSLIVWSERIDMFNSSGGIQFLDRMLLLARYSKQCIKVKAQNNGYCDKSQVPQDKIALSTKVINLDWKKGFSELESVLYKNATWDLCWAEERGRCISMLKHTAFIYKIHNWYDLS